MRIYYLKLLFETNRKIFIKLNMEQLSSKDSYYTVKKITLNSGFTGKNCLTLGVHKPGQKYPGSFVFWYNFALQNFEIFVLLDMLFYNHSSYLV